MKAGAQGPRRPLQVLVVDDSAVVRQVMALVLSKDGNINVTAAADPLIALDKMRHQRPDVILLDLEMPRMDGLTFLQRVMSEDPIPVVVCSSLAGKGTEVAMRALELGAVEIVNKPKLGVRDFLEDSAVLLLEAVRGASQARMRAPRIAVAPKVTADAVLPRAKAVITRTTDKVVAIGASTGGTEALRELFEALPPDSPGLVVVQHMPEAFTAAFAKRLNSSCRIEVKEAADGDRVKDGRALIAPGNKHMLLVRTGAHYMVRVVEGPLVSRHRPSVDVLFRSVAQAAGANALGLIMTGMGDDGAQGLLEMRRAGAQTLAQDEATCVVFGMPKEAIARGAVDEVLPLPRLAQAILKRAASIAPRAHRPV
jgi:two-component system, chemotaxis family, protein-glutamate methylesterase/glutaminase